MNLKMYNVYEKLMCTECNYVRTVNMKGKASPCPNCGNDKIFQILAVDKNTALNTREGQPDPVGPKGIDGNKLFRAEIDWKDKKTISLHDHRLKRIDISQGVIHCSCGMAADGWQNGIDWFNHHQKEELNKQLKQYGIVVE